jgi:putative ABC transport system permease protein
MGGGEQRPLISASLVQTLRRVPGVAADEGSAYGYARLTGKNGKALGNPAAGAPALGGRAGLVPLKEGRSPAARPVPAGGTWPLGTSEGGRS